MDKHHRVVFTADIHGNEIQYKLLIDYAIKNNIESVIIGGDIALKGFDRDVYIQQQRKFLEKKLVGFLKELKKKSPKTTTYIMMGNDDAGVNMDVLEKYDDELFRLIHNKRLRINEDYDIVGYSFVPITPFGIKDWEKYDLSDVPKELRKKYNERKETGCRLQGFKSTKNGLKDFSFTENIEKTDSIQKDLAQELFTKNPIKTVYVMHSPPNATHLDITYNSYHVGSFAIREFIEKYQPYLTLHGHIHETVAISGKFWTQIGRTYSLTPGNHNKGKELAILDFDLYNPTRSDRKII